MLHFDIKMNFVCNRTKLTPHAALLHQMASRSACAGNLRLFQPRPLNPAIPSLQPQPGLVHAHRPGSVAALSSPIPAILPHHCSSSFLQASNSATSEETT